jgi:quinolinate synthase
MGINLNDLEKVGFLKVDIDPKLNLIEEINRLKKEKNAIILGHFYQEPEIQDISDFVGDSLQLAQQGAKTDADIIVLAGVHFMAESAKILSPEKKVLVPDLKAGCSLADSCPPDEFKKFVEKQPDHIVISYVNTTAEIKALTDICCTSSNAVQIVESLPENQKIIFAPDRNLGNYINSITNRNMVLWDGACHVHEEFSLERILELKKEFPDAKILAHPECEKPILIIADYIGSTAKMLKYTIEDSNIEYIVATESGILHQMQKANPDKKFIAAPPKDSSCGCNNCQFMRLNTIEKLYTCLKYELPEITMAEDLRIKAVKSIQKMLDISKNLNI